MTRASVHLALLLTALVTACPGGDPGTSATGTTTTTSNPDGTDGDSTTSQNTTDSSASTGTSTTTGTTDVPTGTSSTTGTTAVDSSTTFDVTSEPTTAEPETTTSTSTTAGECSDPGPEPSDVEAQALPLPDQACLNEEEDFFGALEAGDVDWYGYHAALACDLEVIHARVQLFQQFEGRVCLFVACDVGPVELECSPAATPSSSPNGVDGCCVDGSGVGVAFACPAATDHSARLSLRLDGADACVEYSGTTGFSWRG
jgi:hypothetical protein